MDRGLKVPVPQVGVYGTKVLSNRVCVSLTVEDLSPPLVGASDLTGMSFLLRNIALFAGSSGVAADAGRGYLCDRRIRPLAGGLPPKLEGDALNPKVNSMGTRTLAPWLQFRSRERFARHLSLPT